MFAGANVHFAETKFCRCNCGILAATANGTLLVPDPAGARIILAYPPPLHPSLFRLAALAW